MSSDICNFYSGKTIFITGATGYLGKAVVWKYLNECHGIDRIYILMREKKGKTAKQRSDDYTSDPIFEVNGLRESGKCEKIVPIFGDTLDPGWGISLEDRQLIIENVNIVIHLAAIVKLNPPLRYAVQRNVKPMIALIEQLIIENVNIVIHLAAIVKLNPPLRYAVQRNVKPMIALIELCYQIKRLDCLVYSSTTAILNGTDNTNERVHQNLTVSPEYVLKACDTLSDEVLRRMKKFFFFEFNNTYCISKALAEQLLLQESSRLNTVIVRPSAILAAYKEPIPGWVQGLQGTTSAAVAVGLGLMKVFPSKKLGAHCVIPVDFVANGLIASIWSHCKQSEPHMKVYHLTTKTNLSPPMRFIMNAIKRSAVKYPSKKVVRPPRLVFLQNRLKLQFEVYVKHWIFAYLLHFIAKLTGIQTHIVKITDKRDRQVFYFDIRDIKWNTYMENMWLGCKRFILKEKDEEISKAKKIYKSDKLEPILAKLENDDRISDDCLKSIHYTIDEGLNMKWWAIKLFDSWGHFPSGFMEGTYGSLGDFDECLDVVPGSGLKSFNVKRNSYSYFWSEIFRERTGSSLWALYVWSTLSRMDPSPGRIFMIISLCASSTWFISAEMQLYVLAYFAMLLLATKLNYGLIYCLCWMVTGMIIPGVLTAYYNIAPPIIRTITEGVAIEELKAHINHCSTYSHLTEYFMGIMTGSWQNV
ncbi:unnamed protein product [Oppiella nova]|uniref:Fatty acyl-CoA reductase n=1 Tax=Oppiella nova TaxID=334625 RepID=A0A7R9LA07_9ACAR|nr:unnamed protein product [Oppiella nova]CAG2160703.1 unnamed protein product [Oppiella nova]